LYDSNSSIFNSSEINIRDENKLISLESSIAAGLSEQKIDATTEYALKNHVIPANLELEHLHGSVNTEFVHGLTTYILRSNVLVTKDRDSAVNQLSPGADLTEGRRRWSVDCGQFTTWTTDQTPDKTIRHGDALSTKETEIVYEAVSNDDVLGKHKVSDDELAEDDIYFENSKVTLRVTSFDDIDKSGVWFDGETLETAFDALERLFKCEEHHIALLNMGFAWQLY
jgi:hypothetical protein